MALNDNNVLRDVQGITTMEEQRILDFLQGAVYSWCKNRKDEWFALRDLVGGDNYFWNSTPLIILYNKHERINNDWKVSVSEAAKDAGWILKKVIKSDTREFATRKVGLVREYKWTGKDKILTTSSMEDAST